MLRLCTPTICEVQAQALVVCCARVPAAPITRPTVCSVSEDQSGLLPSLTVSNKCACRSSVGCKRTAEFARGALPVPRGCGHIDYLVNLEHILATQQLLVVRLQACGAVRLGCGACRRAHSLDARARRDVAHLQVWRQARLPDRLQISMKSLSENLLLELACGPARRLRVAGPETLHAHRHPGWPEGYAKVLPQLPCKSSILSHVAILRAMGGAAKGPQGWRDAWLLNASRFN